MYSRKFPSPGLKGGERAVLKFGGIDTFADIFLNGEKIGETLCIIEPRDRSGLANEKVEKPTWHQWDGQCGNPEIIPIGYNTALLFYGDFYYPDENGVKRKTILCRKITVEK